MGDNGGAYCDGMRNTVRKKRSLTCRRPRPEGSNLLTPSDNFSKISSDDIPAFDTNPRRKEFSLSQCISRAESIAESERGNNDSRRREIINRNKRSTEGLLAPASWKNTTREDEGNDVINGKGTDLGELEGETKRMKLKIGGVSRLVHANGSSRKSSKPVNDTTRSNHDLQVNYRNLDILTKLKLLNCLASNEIYCTFLYFLSTFALSIFFGKCYALFGPYGP